MPPLEQLGSSGDHRNGGVAYRVGVVRNSATILPQTWSTIGDVRVGSARRPIDLAPAAGAVARPELRAPLECDSPTLARFHPHQVHVAPGNAQEARMVEPALFPC